MGNKKNRPSYPPLLSAIEALPESVLGEIASALKAQAREKKFLLKAEAGEEELIPLALSPWVVRPACARYLQGFFRGIRRTVNRILKSYFEDPRLQAILPLRESELKWLKAICGDGIPRPQTLFERFDTNLGPPVEENLSSFQVIEFNAVGVGCIHLMPAGIKMLQTHLLPRLKESLPELSLNPPADYRRLLLEELKGHARALEAASCRVGLVERRESVPGGVDEFNELANFFTSQEVPAWVGDPREVEWVNQQLRLKGEPIDVIYRDFQIEEVVSIQTHGGSVEAIQEAFCENRVVSTVFGEFDHKSLCELLTTPDFSDHFSPQELRAARMHFPWTRLVEERKTIDGEGKEVDLADAIRKGREHLVLKPNRGYGGEGVIVGETVSASDWERAVEQAFQKSKAWVVQEKVPISKAQVMILRERGRPKAEEQFVTLGVTATSRGVAFVGRSSEEPVVNISRGGALVPVFLGGKG